jgi:hypothetical protein
MFVTVDSMDSQPGNRADFTTPFRLGNRRVEGKVDAGLPALAAPYARIRRIKLEPCSQFVFNLQRSLPRHGEDRLTVTLDSRPSDLTGNVGLPGMELLLRD